MKKSYKKRSIFLLLLIYLLFPGLPSAFAQRTISGKVTDENQLALPGVNVVMKGTSQGTITDIEGNYTLGVSDEDGTLVFSFVGFLSQEIPIDNQSTIDVVMANDVTSLEEVVVVGYGTQKKKDITGAVSVVDVEEMDKSQYVTLTDRLQGRVPGVSVSTSGAPGVRGDIKIRGTSFFGNNNPLYVIDGVLTDDSPNLNPNDIETVQVLKDASSTAIYGSRAANGVIVITTKQGRSGKPVINFTANVGIQQIPTRIDVADNAQWARIVNAAHDNGGLTRQTLAQNVPNINTDWQEELFNDDALLQDYNLSISGGGNNNRVYFSANHTSQEGTIEGPMFERLSTRLNTEFEPIKNLTIGENLTISRAKNSGLQELKGVDFEGPSVIDAVHGMLPVIPVYDPTKMSGYGHGELGVATTFVPNPVGVRDMFHNESAETRILGNLFLNYQFIEGLEYQFSLGLNADFNQSKSYNRPGQVRMTTLHLSGLTESRGESQELFIENRLTYNKEFGKHTLSAMATYTEQEINGSSQETVSVGGYDTENPFWVISASTVNTSSTGEEFSSAIRSYLGRVTYKFDDRYLLTGIIRRDGSSKFAKENRWGTFPSLSGGWNITNEKFFDVELISDLKVRAGYGEVGNASIGDYQYQSGILSTASGGVNYNLGPSSESVIGATRGQIVNRDIRWETLKETNIGVDLELLDGKVAFTGDYYFGTLEDLLSGVPVPSTIGAGEGEPTLNAVTMKRNGWEAAITYRKVTGDFQYSISANAFHTNNEVEELPFGVKEFIGINSVSRPGLSLGQLFLLDYQGIYTSQAEIDALDPDFTINGARPQVGDAKYRDTNSRDEDGNLTGEPDGQISLDDDRIIAGDPIPAVQYGFNFDGSYRNFDVTVFFQGVTSRDIFNTYYDELNTNHTSNYTADYDPWIDGEGSDPRPVIGEESGNSLPSTRFMENGAYFRLKNLQVGYTIPWERIQNIRVYLSSQNLFTLTDYRGMDPEFGGEVFSPGIDPREYPNIRTYSVGVNLTL